LGGRAPGGGGADTLSGIENVITGAGNDSLLGDGAGNILSAGSGNDTLAGGSGNDTLTGGTGNDSLNGDSGVDWANYADATGSVDVYLASGESYSAEEIDSLSGIENVLTGAGNDRVEGDALDNIISTGAGNDEVTGGAGNDSIDGGDGLDILTFNFSTGSVTVNLLTGRTSGAYGSDSIAGIEHVWVTGSGNDHVTGNGLSNNLGGGFGNDTLLGDAGNDTLTGGSSNDSIVGGSDRDLLDYSGISGSVSVFIGAVRNGEGNASGAGGNDTFTGIEDVRTGSGNDSVKGDLLANNLSGGEGNDTLLGDGGDDTLTGGTGNDSLNGGNDVDWVSYAERPGAVTVNLTTGRASGSGGADSLSGIENVLTGAGNDNVTGSSLDNIISAGTGNDTIVSNSGNDTISGGLGNDSLNGGIGNDHFIFDTALGTANVDRIQSYSATDDTILLDDAIFTALGSPGALAAGAFKAGTAATDADDRIIFNAATGALFYDQDGNGAAAAVQFATLTSITGTITNADFLII
jgi:Ca2+-binding RTX toxin-like protein